MAEGVLGDAHQIVEHVFLGSAAAASNLENLVAAGVSHICTVNGNVSRVTGLCQTQ